VYAQELARGMRAAVRLLTHKGLKGKKIEMEFVFVHGDEAIQISALMRRGMRFLQGRTKLRGELRSGTFANADLTQVIADLIRGRPFLS
jgi:hypothetical protein